MLRPGRGSSVYGDKEGYYPADPSRELVPKYIAQIPEIELEHHKASASFRVVSDMKGARRIDDVIGDTGAWLYVGDKASPLFGTIAVDCSHQDSKGKPWFQY